MCYVVNESSLTSPGLTAHDQGSEVKRSHWNALRLCVTSLPAAEALGAFPPLGEWDSLNDGTQCFISQRLENIPKK